MIIHLVESKVAVRDRLVAILEKHSAGFEILRSDLLLSARQAFYEAGNYDLLLCSSDLLAQPEDLRIFLALHPSVLLVIYTDHLGVEVIGQALRAGAYQCVALKDLEADIEGTLKEPIRFIHKVQEETAASALVKENKRLSEMDLLKTEFFTNISHELRTPLTVIRGMAEQIEESPGEWTSKGLSLIQKNTNDLLNLVNQILDLHKLESGNIKSHPVQTDIIPFLAYVAQLFEHLAERTGLEFTFSPELSSLVMDFDVEKLQRILFNLLGNAIKFTPPGGTVRLNASRVADQVLLQIEDTGVGIRKEILDRIFDRFFQSKENFHNVKIGTGIGLALVKELVILSGGDITVDSEPGVGSRFQVFLPIENKATKVNLPASDLASNKVPKPVIEPGLKALQKPDFALAERPNLLIVEDNPDIVTYLKACLEVEYSLSVAPDGESGRKLALETVPDLIISDVMMPKMSGTEMCAILKKDQRTSHIPIVLLTAKADEDSRIQGLMQGADAYLTKPFNRQELLVRLGALHTLRQSLRERYQSLDHFLNTHTPINVDDTFMVTLYKEVGEKSIDPDYGVQQLSKSMALSRTQIHRKIKALTGRSTTSFIRWVRLTQARKLIRESDQRISEIAYNVGFSDPKYFSRSYQKEFGHSPSVEKTMSQN